MSKDSSSQIRDFSVEVKLLASSSGNLLGGVGNAKAQLQAKPLSLNWYIHDRERFSSLFGGQRLSSVVLVFFDTQ